MSPYSVFAAIPSYGTPVMVLDHSHVLALVLVVEDEMLLRMRAVDIVEDAGFASVEALDADEAVAILESRSDIALLFTDIQMPGSMDGLGFAHAVHERWPPVKIILVSGQLKPADIDIPANSCFFGNPARRRGEREHLLPSEPDKADTYGCDAGAVIDLR